MNTRFLIAFSLLLSAISSPLFAGPFPESTAPLLAGEEAKVRGVINAIIFPISDDFEMEPTQSGVVLITPLPLEAAGLDNEGNEIHETNLTLFQLAGEEAVLAQCEALAGKPVEITADLMPAHTRYHRTPFLLLVKSVRAL